VVAASEDVGFERVAVRDEDQILAGSLTVTAMHTPGHTPGHLSYVLGEAAHGPAAVFTGGSMLYGAVGRTDLISPEHTERLTRAQYRSVRRLAAVLPDEVAVYPTHGFGSFCSATPTTGTSSTIARERRANIALRSDEDAFVRELIAGLNAYPRYYAHMGPANRRGPRAPDLAPPARADPAELRRRIDAGEWIVDLSGGRMNGRQVTCRTLCTSRSGSLRTAPARCQAARFGSTAPAASAPRSARLSSTGPDGRSSTSTTTGKKPHSPGCRSSI
jgi:hydroxyacylglutathione hydrolase